MRQFSVRLFVLGFCFDVAGDLFVIVGGFWLFMFVFSYCFVVMRCCDVILCCAYALIAWWLLLRV